MPEMKDSGIAWVQQIPKHWSVIPNKYVMKKEKIICPKYNGQDILSLTMNGVIVRNLDAGGKMPASFDGYQIVFPNNLLMCLFDYDVTPRCIGLIRNHGLTSPAYSQFVMRNGNSEKYYYYYYLMVDTTKELLHLDKNLRHSFTEEQLGMINVPVPPINEQIAIANILDKKCSEIDALSADIQSQIDILEEYKKSVITDAVTKGLNPDVEMKDSGYAAIGKIARDFECKRIKQCIVGMVDGTHGTFQRTNEGQMLLSAKNVFEDGLHISDMESLISESDYKTIIKNGYPRKNDVLLCCVGTVGRCMIYTEDTPIAFQRSILFLRCDEKTIIPKMLFYCLQSNSTLVQERMAITKSAQEGLYQGSVAELRIAFPKNIDMQQKIVSYLDTECMEINAVIADKKVQLETLAEYKKSLIYEYVTGKKEVPADV